MRSPTCQLSDLSAFRLVGKSETWRVGKLAGRPEEVIARCSDCIVLSPLPAGCREDGRQGGVAALGGQGAGTEKGGEAVQQGERKEV